MEGAFGVGVMGDGLSEVERVRNFGHGGIPGADDGLARRSALLPLLGSPVSGRPLALCWNFGCTRRAVGFRSLLLKMWKNVHIDRKRVLIFGSVTP